MSKFKVGDLVKIVGENGYGGTLAVGSIGRVMNVEDEAPYVTELGHEENYPNGLYCYAHTLELYKPKDNPTSAVENYGVPYSVFLTEAQITAAKYQGMVEVYERLIAGGYTTLTK